MNETRNPKECRMTNDEQGGPAVAALAYASPRIEKPSRSIYRAVIVLGALPIVLGGLALLLFWAMRWNWGPDHTTLLVVMSVGLILAGCVAFFVFFLRERRYKRMAPGSFQLRIILAALLLVADLPVVGFYIFAPQKMTRRMTVTVIN